MDAKQAAQDFRKEAQQLFGVNVRTGIDKTLDQVKATIDAEIG